MSNAHHAVSSLWLLAGQEDEALLSGIVAGLAGRHATPLFHPHLTILGDIPRPPGELAGVLPRIARAAAPFALPVRDVVPGEAFFRSFYAAFDAVPALLALRRAAGVETGATSGPFMPHVSLLYGAVPAPAKSASIAEIARRLVGRPIHFDRLVLTNSADAVPVADWRILHTARLTAAP